MNKMQMAHEYALEMLKETIPTGSLYGGEARSVAESIVKSAFALADMMQAEADERECKERPEVLKEEWQPDWSQAPALTTGWSVHSNGSAKWHISHGSMTIPAPLFGYTGNWQDSLRKRPQ